MPAKSRKMQQFMGICAHHPSAARGKCPSHAVAEEFSHKPAGGYPEHVRAERAQARKNRKYMHK